MRFFTMDDFDLTGRTVLLRVDINSPLDPSTGRFLDFSRVESHIQTIRELERTKLIIMAHQSKPGKGDYTDFYYHRVALQQAVKRRVIYVDDIFGSSARDWISHLHDGDILLLENVRFAAEEVTLSGKPVDVQSSSHLVRKLAPLIDFYINDAFAAAHRSQPSLVGFAHKLPSMAGRVMEREVTMMERAMDASRGTRVAVLGGVKVQDSLDVARSMLDGDRVDTVLTVGAVGNLFLWAMGVDIGDVNKEFLSKEVPDPGLAVAQARGLLEKYEKRIEAPFDVVIDDDGEARRITIAELPTDKPILDIGLESTIHFASVLEEAGTIIANGPAGVFEDPRFEIGTVELFKAIARSKGFSVLGGGHTGVVAEKLQIRSNVDHISTGGGATVTYLSGACMPVIDELIRCKDRMSVPDELPRAE